MLCIICLKEKPPSAEHVFPYAIGGSLVTNRVCKGCNSILGSKVDARLTEHQLIVMHRDRLQLGSEKGNVPFALTEIFDNTYLSSDPAQKIKLTEAKNRKLRAKIVYNRVENANEVTINIDASARKSIPTIIQRERIRAGLPALPAAEINAITSNITAHINEIQQPSIHGRIKINLIDYYTPLLKIAYEMAHWWLGDIYLDDPEATYFREALNNSDISKSPIQGKFEIGIMEPFRLWDTETNRHLAFCFSEGNKIRIGIKIFNAFTAVIVVSQNASNYSITKNDNCFVSLDAVNRTHEFSTFIEARMRAVAAKKIAVLLRYLKSTVSPRSMMLRLSSKR